GRARRPTAREQAAGRRRPPGWRSRGPPWTCRALCSSPPPWPWWPAGSRWRSRGSGGYSRPSARTTAGRPPRRAGAGPRAAQGRGRSGCSARAGGGWAARTRSSGRGRAAAPWCWPRSWPPGCSARPCWRAPPAGRCSRGPSGWS
ncbi:unnamed protein product, partial [Prorocentrum cordatum]